MATRPPRPFDPRRLELQRFGEEAAALDGECAPEQLGRLAPDAPPQGPVRWSARGECVPVTGGAPETWLHLQARATVGLVCQRCLQPMAVPLAVERRVRFVADEAEAERLDEASEDDVLALPPRGRLDLPALVEDELILALPLVPRHETCPQPLPLPAEDPVADAAEAEDRPRPFAALARLRKGD